MSDLPGHSLPNFTDEAAADALFHYTTATGLNGILSDREIWATAYYCSNDEAELAEGFGILQPLFRSTSSKLKHDEDSRVMTFRNRGIDIFEFGDRFEKLISGWALSILCAYITCFCKPRSKEDFHHGLLSQWRGYGSDGGYAIQFSRNRLIAALELTNRAQGTGYDLQDVQYEEDNILRSEVLDHSASFVRSYLAFLDEQAKPLDFSKKTFPSPLSFVDVGPLQTYLNYLVHRKSKHFSEENECRLSLLQPVSPGDQVLPVTYFNRAGLLVPYTMTPRVDFDVLGCVDWVIVGPGPRMKERFRSITQFVKQLGLAIQVRPSHIPFTRL